MIEANNLLVEASNILDDRHEQYGDARQLHQKMGSMIGNQLNIECSSSDAALVMAQIKLARLANGVDDPAAKKDTFIDAINYIAIAWECST
tara:strand:+ start:70 stop:342 length:273 start_codon:yes stop_codon:yes gene_type:complete